ncbi:MAG TPA: P-II family nitrogen regulator [Gammaproteobacteria bacterium]|nr:P-II family nitrogen regulator [Gammaproteobacteria bacterium]
MKEVKAFVHRNRVADVLRALKSAGYCCISIVDVKGMLEALDPKEREFSLELGAEMITEVKLELVCEDEELDQAVALIRENARTGQATAGWICVNDLSAVYPIDG